MGEAILPFPSPVPQQGRRKQAGEVEHEASTTAEDVTYCLILLELQKKKVLSQEQVTQIKLGGGPEFNSHAVAGSGDSPPTKRAAPSLQSFYQEVLPAFTTTRGWVKSG